MDELAEKASRFGKVIRADYRNTYDYRTRTLATAFNWRTSRKIAPQWKKLRPDIIHVNKQNLEDGLDLLRAAGRCGVPSVCRIHITQTARYLDARLPWLRDWIARRALNNYRGIIVTARRRALEEFLRRSTRIETIFNGVPLVDLNQKPAMRAAKRHDLGLSSDDFLILGLARLVAQKQPFVFLELAKVIHQRFPAAKFLWVGDGKLSAQWDEWVARENLGGVISRVHWQTDVLPFLFAGDLLLHVAKYEEGLPLAIAEAMAAGLPCAVTGDFAAEITFFHQDNVLFLDDAQSLADRLSDSEALSRVAVGGRRLVEEKLSIPAMVDAYERLYAEAIQE
jgi:glycosyltransferase involved in cell wall biosynthesis